MIVLRFEVTRVSIGKWKVGGRGSAKGDHFEGRIKRLGVEDGEQEESNVLVTLLWLRNSGSTALFFYFLFLFFNF